MHGCVGGGNSVDDIVCHTRRIQRPQSKWVSRSTGSEFKVALVVATAWMDILPSASRSYKLSGSTVGSEEDRGCTGKCVHTWTAYLRSRLWKGQVGEKRIEEKGRKEKGRGKTQSLNNFRTRRRIARRAMGSFLPKPKRRQGRMAQHVVRKKTLLLQATLERLMQTFESQKSSRTM
eukprot:1140388-Pelagomonas_calceolata.AAC.1